MGGGCPFCHAHYLELLPWSDCLVTGQEKDHGFTGVWDWVRGLKHIIVPIKLSGLLKIKTKQSMLLGDMVEPEESLLLSKRAKTEGFVIW